MNYVLSEQTVGKFAQFARNVWGIVEQEEEVAAKKVFKHCMITLWLVAFQ